MPTPPAMVCCWRYSRRSGSSRLARAEVHAPVEPAVRKILEEVLAGHTVREEPLLDEMDAVIAIDRSSRRGSVLRRTGPRPCRCACRSSRTPAGGSARTDRRCCPRCRAGLSECQSGCRSSFSVRARRLHQSEEPAVLLDVLLLVGLADAADHTELTEAVAIDDAEVLPGVPDSSVGLHTSSSARPNVVISSREKPTSGV